MQLDELDRKATAAYEGYVVRKDLVRKFKGQYPVPTYVAEFLLGRYCASVDEDEIEEEEENVTLLGAEHASPSVYDGTVSPSMF